MFIQKGGDWPTLTANVQKHKMMVLRLSTDDKTGRLQEELTHRLNKAQPGGATGLKVIRAPKYDDSTTTWDRKYAYLIYFDFKSNKDAKALLSGEY